MASISISWTQFKAEASARALVMQYVATDDIYFLCIFDGLLELNCIIRKPSIEQDEFEAIYKALCNKTPVQEKPFADSQGFRGRLKGISGTAAVNDTTNIDYLITEERWISGIQIILKNQSLNDTGDFIIVDKDNVLGFGVGFIVDIYVASWNFSSDAENQGDYRSPYPAKIPAGLYLRIAYHATGIISPVTVKVNYFLHKKA